MTNAGKFIFTAEMESQFKEKAAHFELTTEHQELAKKLIEKHAVPCYTFKKLDAAPTALDSSIAGIPYLPIGETLPKEKLVIQINFEGIDLEGYPNKGIFQLFAPEDCMDIEDDEIEQYIDEIDENDYFEYEGECGAIARYYPNVSDNFQKDVPASLHRLNGAERKANKLELKKTWSLPPTCYYTACPTVGNLYTGFDNCELLKQVKELKEEGFKILNLVAGINESYQNSSKIGGYWSTPQSINGGPDAAFLFLSEDMIDWGDSGAFYFSCPDQDITKIEKDVEIENYGDMC